MIVIYHISLCADSAIVVYFFYHVVINDVTLYEDYSHYHLLCHDCDKSYYYFINSYHDFLVNNVIFSKISADMGLRFAIYLFHGDLLKCQ